MNTASPIKPPSDHARVTDAATLLPLLGVFLLMPPIITLVVGGAGIDGVPLIVVYVFGVWLALIVCAAFLARRLTVPGRRDAADEPPG